MLDDKKPADYMASINKARRKRNKPPYVKYAAAAAVILVAAGGIFFGTKALRNGRGADPASVTESGTGESELSPEQMESQQSESEAAASKAAEELAQHEARVQEVIGSYSNLGIVQVSGYLNMRKSPESNAQVVGKILNNGACEILESLDGWYHVSSGGIEGYVSSQYVFTGEQAAAAAKENVLDRAVITADKLNIRKEPSTTADIVGQALINERYEITDVVDGWYQIPNGYISADYSEEKLCLNEARKLDMKAMVLSLYDNPGVSNVTNYLNIRESAGESAKIIGKLPSYAGCEILETQDGWYKIRSGKITGYVKSDYILTGDTARQAAMEHADLMAVVSTDGLNARTEPSTDAKIWTQLSSNERYHVLSQMDGWVQIEFDEGGEGDSGNEVSSAYVSTDYVDVRYALAEAVKFSQAEEKASLRSQIVNYAMQFLGNPYVWGGTSLTKGADCSGFTMQIMKHFGISLPHYSGDQAKRGTRIKSGDMRPGDLIFYGNSRGTINHVAMYIGNGQIIHAASRRSGIKISTWNYRTPLRIVNVIGD